MFAKVWAKLIAIFKKIVKTWFPAFSSFSFSLVTSDSSFSFSSSIPVVWPSTFKGTSLILCFNDFQNNKYPDQTALNLAWLLIALKMQINPR